MSRGGVWPFYRGIAQAIRWTKVFDDFVPKMRLGMHRGAIYDVCHGFHGPLLTYPLNL